ncbi:MAG: PHP domain-containing protein [Candidatus Sumerlaeia bacterium]|nr:PHP domain-containing protein [Candidatus Sumerlaeia bacterium]
MSDRWKTYSGVVHVHTDRSGGAPLDVILEAARATNADFVVLTDCGIRMGEARQVEGWHDDVLVLVGEEVCCPDGHFLAFGTSEEIGHATSFEHSLELVRAQSGSAVGTHYHFAGTTRPAHMPPPLPLAHVDLAELWSFQDEFVSRAKGRMAVQFHGRPERLLMGPEPAVLRAWDAELLKRPLPAVGSVTALTRKEPLLDWKEYFPCKTSFRTIRTVIRCPELPRNSSSAACHLAWNALRRGTSYLVNLALGDPADFDVAFVDRTREYRIGDTALWRGSGRIRLHLPVPAEVILRLNSYPLLWGTGQDIDFPAPAPGVYRVEVRLDRRCWILSNAIRVVHEERGTVRPTTIGEFT